MHPKPKKRLGQNFLIDKNIREKIIEACELNPADIILEIGAGNGEMTGLISKRVLNVSALEIDRGLCGILSENFKTAANVTVINGDILKFNLGDYFKNIRTKIKVIGNIPYYITTPIIEHLLLNKDKIEAVYITVQKEFAARVTSSSGSKKYGSLSLFLQYYTEPRILFFISKNCFRPIPKVDSCLLKLKIREKPQVSLNNETLFFRIIRAGFNKRRKTLRNSLKGIVEEEKLEKFFKKYNIKSNTRPERFTINDFANLANV